MLFMLFHISHKTIRRLMGHGQQRWRLPLRRDGDHDGGGLQEDVGGELPWSLPDGEDVLAITEEVKGEDRECDQHVW